jgi:iron(III) transport system substrate-binding protein
MNKLQAEFMAGAPRPDVLLIADAMSMEQLKAGHHLLAYPGADVSAFPQGVYDKDRTYFGTKLITTGIMVNAHAPFRPQSWKDLLRPEAKGKVVLPSPLYSGAAMITLGAIGQDPALGLSYFQALAKNNATAVQGNGQVLTAVAGGQSMYGIGVDFMALNAKAKGSPVDFVFPEEGVTAVTEPVAILSTAHNQAAARAFVDFLLSKDGQAMAAHQGFLPARADVPPPPGFPPLKDIRVMKVDVARILQDSAQLKQSFADDFGG